MSNNKQSSVIDFYRYRIIQITADGLNKRITGEQWDLLERKAYEQAKAMDKDQHIKTWEAGLMKVDFNEYYNETFGGNNEQQ